MKFILTILFTCICMYSVDAWSHFSSIGYDLLRDIPEYKDSPKLGLEKFWLSTAEDPDTVYHSVTNANGRSDEVAHSTTPCGAELWSAIKFNDQLYARDLLGFDPHFFGSSRIAVDVEERNEDDNECEAWLKAHADCTLGQLEFDCPNYLLYKNRLKERPNVIVQRPLLRNNKLRLMIV